MWPTPPAADAPSAKTGKGFPKKALLFGGIGAAVVAALVVVLLLVLGGGSGKLPSYALYVKDKEIFFSDLSGDPWQLTDQLVDSKEYDNSGLSYSSSTLGRYCRLSENGKYIFFLDKFSDGYNLYYKEADEDAERIKIDSDVGDYYVDSAAKFVTYYKDGNLYQYDIGEDSKEKIASDVDDDFYVSKDGKRIIYYTEDDSVYLYDGDEKVKIGSEIGIEYADEEFKVFYYFKDESLYRYELDGEKEKIASKINYVIKVYESGEAYYVKDDKDAENTGRVLYYYDGEAEIKLADDYAGYGDYARNAPVLAYSVYDGTERELFIATKEISTKIKAEKAGNICINDAGTLAYYFDDVNDKDEGTLYRVEISGDEIGKPESFAEDVSSDYNYGFINDEQFYYFKDFKDDKGELYINEDKVDDDVREYIRTPHELGKVFYYTDYKDGVGTLKVYDGKGSEKIADDVYSYTVLPNGHVLYLTDYSTKSYTGDLYDWDGGDAEKLDEDVVCILS